MIIVAYMERTPYEVSFPSYGISYNTTDDASTWYSGFRVHRCPELPLHFTIAMTGCAMSILLTSYVETGGELDKCFLEHVGMIVTSLYFLLFCIIIKQLSFAFNRHLLFSLVKYVNLNKLYCLS